MGHSPWLNSRLVEPGHVMLTVVEWTKTIEVTMSTGEVNIVLVVDHFVRSTVRNLEFSLLPH